jgi:hypothetical protein
MKVDQLSFGSISIDGRQYDKDILIDSGRIKKRSKRASKAYAEGGHTPLTAFEEIPWNCDRLVIGTGQHGSLPIHQSIRAEASKRGVQLEICTTPEAIAYLNDPGTNLILHLTC